MLRNLLNKYNADNTSELMKNIFSGLRKEQVSDSYVKEVIEHKTKTPRGFDFSDILEQNRLADILPYEWADKDTNIIQTSRAYGFVFNCGTIIGSRSDLDEQLRGLFNLGIPDGTCMQIMLLASSELEDKFNKYKALRKTPLLSAMADSTIEYYRKGLKKSLQDGYKFPVRDFKLYISFAFEGLYEEEKKSSIVSLQQSISVILRNSYVNNELMNANQVINLVRELMCTSTKPIEPHIYDERLPIRDQIADIDNNIYVDCDGLCINDMGLKSIAIGRYPEQFNITQCDKFIGDAFSIASQISYPFFITQNITFLNQSAENLKLQSAAMATANQVKPGKFTALFELFHKKHAEYKLLQSVISNGEGLMLMNHMIHVYHPLGESEIAFQEVKSLYKSFGFSVVTNTNLQLPALLCSLPLYHDFISSLEQKKLRMMSLYTQTNVVNLMPLFADARGSGNPLLMFLSTRGQVMFFDLYQSDTNYNMVLSAESGAGKSFLVNYIIAAYRAIGAKIRVIDVGKSFKKFVELNGGISVEFTNDAALCINPFSFIKFKFEDGREFDLSKITREELLAQEDLDDQITMLKSIFLVSAGISEEDQLHSLADSYFEQAILSSLQQYQTDSTYTTVYDELLKIKDESGVANKLAESIKSFTKHGIFGKYFEGKSNLDIDNEAIVLELEELQSKGKLKFVVLLIIMLKISQDMYLAEDRLQRKICVIDEAWDLMDGGTTGEFIKRGYRRARKYNGSFITITQSLDDYFLNPTTKSCYDNSGIKVMMKQPIPKEVELDEYTKTSLRSLNSINGVYSDFIFEMNKTQTRCRYLPDMLSMEMFTTKAIEVGLIKLVEEASKKPKLEVFKTIVRLREEFKLKYKGDRDFATNELIRFINVNGYQSLLNHFGIKG